MTCEGCVYYVPKKTTAIDQGEAIMGTEPAHCRRYAPRQGHHRWSWPATDGKGCGEYRKEFDVSALEFHLAEITETLRCIADRMPS